MAQLKDLLVNGASRFIGPVQLPSGNPVFANAGIQFSSGARIGQGSAVNAESLCIYSPHLIALRPNSITAASTDGIEITADGLYPTNNGTENLGLSDHKWSNFYIKNINAYQADNTINITTQGFNLYNGASTPALGVHIGTNSYQQCYIGSPSSIFLRPESTISNGTLTSTHGIEIQGDTTNDITYLLPRNSTTTLASSIGSATRTWKQAYIDQVMVNGSDTNYQLYVN